MRKQLEIEVKVGLFVGLGLVLIMLAILILGSTENLMSRKNHYTVHFSNIDGLFPGAKVVLGGIQIGTVQTAEFNMDKRDINVQVSVTRESGQWIRKDSTAELATQGVLGDKYISVTPGTLEHPPLPDGADIPSVSSKNLSQFLSKGDQLLISLNGIAGSLDRLLKSFEQNNRSEIFFQGIAATAKNLSHASEKLNSELDQLHIKTAISRLNNILEKVNNGTGTLGALINDPGLYDDAKALMGEANRNRIIRNLVRRTLKNAEESSSKPVPIRTPAPQR